MSVSDRKGARCIGRGGPRRFQLDRSSLGCLRSCGSFGLGKCGLFGAQRFDASGLEARGFSSECFLLCRKLCRGLCGSRRSGRLLLGSRLDIRRFPASSDGPITRNRDGLGNGLGSGNGSTPTRGRLRRRLSLGTDTLLAFPARPNACDLVVGEHAHVAANRNVHLPKKADDFIGGHCEFVCQLTH
jgi:hypothetical protein